ncbi:benzoate-CoA ligase family protein [soil metagenome]
MAIVDLTIDKSPTSSPTSAHIDTFVIDGLPPEGTWPDFVFGTPELQYPSRLNAAAVLLDDAVDRGWGDRPCVGLGDISWTYAELQARANSIANALVDEYGIVPGNRVLLRGPNAPWMVAAWYATLKVGGVVVTTMPMLRAPELDKIYTKCSPAVALCEQGMDTELRAVASTPVACWGDGGELSAAMADAPTTFTTVDTAATDPALLAFTSGTTGEPKAVIQFHRDVLACADVFLPVLAPVADDIFVGSPPLAFTFGLGGLVIFPMRVGASTQFGDEPGPDALARLIERCRATVCFTAPLAYASMITLDPPADLSSLRRAVSAGEHLPEATFRAFEAATGVRLIDGIGATEMMHIFISAADDDIRPGATGRPLLGYEARIVDDAMCDVADGMVGHLAVRGPIGCRYLADARQADYVVDGWNLTGDSFVRDADGYFHFRARTDDMIISSGYNIAAPDVAQALVTHAAVRDAAVIGVADEQRGMIVKAIVHLADPAAASPALADELQAYVKATIAPYKYPRIVEFSAEPLPKTATGKLQRTAVRERYG